MRLHGARLIYCQDMSCHRAYNLTAALSALMFAATVALWVRSYRARETVVCCSSRARTWLGVSCGGVGTGRYGWLPMAGALYPIDRFYHLTLEPADPYFPDDASTRGVRGGWGFYFLRYRTSAGPGWDIHFPCWSLAALTAIFPALRLAAWQHRRRTSAAGRCAVVATTSAPRRTGVPNAVRLPGREHETAPARLV